MMDDEARRDSGFSPVRAMVGPLQHASERVKAPPAVPRTSSNPLVVRDDRPRLRHFDYKGEYAYHLTISTLNRRPVFLDEGLGRNCILSLKRAASDSAFNLLAFVFMPDHFHALVQGQTSKSDLKTFVSRFKQFTGYPYKKETGQQLWQTSYFDRVLRHDEALQDVADYVLLNPVMEGLASSVTSYGLSGGLYFDNLCSDRAEAAVPTNTVGYFDTLFPEQEEHT